MSVPKDKLNKLLNELDEKDTSKVLEFAESLKKRKGKRLKPSDFRGIWKHKKLDVEKISRELRAEWDRDIS
ncbi:MAG: hypothetical protein A2Y25_02780 [Candidatus Melainabacteria bacterium GWF2_37_15]|nr:MAG: hypothetical protein A2Y25_02780 [Candidatus Melainabacteria bacterium GWF2_37_15]